MGAIFGVVALYLTLVGLVEAFSERYLIANIVALGQVWLIIVGLAVGYVVASRREDDRIGVTVLHGATSGAVTGLVVAIYILFASEVNLRNILVNSSPALLELLSLGKGAVVGAILQIVIGGILGALGSLVEALPTRWRQPLVTGSGVLLLLGIVQDLLKVLLQSGTLRPVSRFFFEQSGLTIHGAVAVFVIAAGINLLRPALNERTTPFRNWINQPEQRAVKYGGLAVILIPLMLALPWIIQVYFSDVLDNVGLYVMMGLGLNIVVGFAGLLDLGYVAFFAIGAYTMGLLTSPASFLGLEWSFWAALPFCMATASLAGIILGIPVLRMRGDYLAIVTLGFGEIIRVLATSDMLKPYIGGAQGILLIPKPQIFGVELVNAQQLYYIALAGCLIVLFVSWRLSDSRVGRTWIAIREDEDVAEAMGVDLVRYKLMAFATGAAFAGFAGAIFASKLSSIFPHSFNLLISINVLSLIIVGGMGSLPGVIVGALILVGLPELLREFAEFRLLMYGALLVAMMLIKPEGFLPAQQRRRELHAAEVVQPEPEAEAEPQPEPTRQTI
jgi:branched-chain amino acid transport system permease protein